MLISAALEAAEENGRWGSTDFPNGKIQRELRAGSWGKLGEVKVLGPALPALCALLELLLTTASKGGEKRDRRGAEGHPAWPRAVQMALRFTLRNGVDFGWPCAELGLGLCDPCRSLLSHDALWFQDSARRAMLQARGS